MSTPDSYGSQPTQPQDPYQPQYPAPAQPQYPAPAQPQYGQPPAYPPAPAAPEPPTPPAPQPPAYPPAAPAYPPAEPPTQPYGAPASGAPAYGAPASGAPAYGAPAAPYGQPTQEYPAGQYPPPPPPPGMVMPAGYQAPPPAKKRGPLAIIGGVLVTLLVIAGIIVVKAVIRIGADSLTDGGTSAAEAPKTPFEGTPADAFAKGEAGITVPAATDVPGFAKADVEKALGDVKKALVAGRLDTKMLTGHDNSAFMALFSPSMQTDLKDYFDKKEFLPFATQIAPNFKLTSDPVRVKGEMTFRGTEVEGLRVIEVVTNYVWVYAFTGELSDPGDHLVTIHDKITWLFPHPEDVIDEAIGMNMSEWEAFASNMDCDLFDQSLIGLGKPRFTVNGGNDDPNDAFDPNGTLNVTDTC